MVPMTHARIPFAHTLLFSTALIGAAFCADIALADAETDRLARAYTSSGIELFDRLAATAPGNLMLSPYSVGTALAMAYAGARGDTQAEMAQILGFDWSPDAIGEVNARLAELVMDRGPDEDASISVANALALTQSGGAVSKDYADLLANLFDAELFADATLEDINAWVSAKTNGRIDPILEQLDPFSIAVLLNALHFSASWDKSFEAYSTRAGDFHLSPAETVSVPMMHQTMPLRILRAEAYDAIALPYLGQQLQLVLFVPSTPGATPGMPVSLDADSLASVLDGLDKATPEKLAFSMPKFTFESGMDLIPALEESGLTLPFDANQADFSGVTGSTDQADRVFISQAEHKAFIDVNEAGTEAAAATAIEIALTAAMPEQVDSYAVDRPFTFAITDKTSNAVLFMGRVVDPRDGLVADTTDDTVDVSVQTPEPVTGLDVVGEWLDTVMAPLAPSEATKAMPSMMAGGAAPRYAMGMPGEGDQFASFEDGRVLSVADEPVSTFSVDVDTAAYSYVRRMLEDGVLPQADAVRVEEMINYFDYGYAGPSGMDTPFAVHTSLFPTPWREGTQLMQIGIQGYRVPAEDRPPANIVFLIDTSGSMDAPDKLPLLKKSFEILLGQLDENDAVSIVTYAGSAGIVLEPTPASDKVRIRAALSDLTPGGSTAGAAGIELAYDLAAQAETAAGTNRVILATDGDFNVGIDDPDALEHFIAKKRDAGISLSVLGFGSGNLDDITMQALAQNGNGTAAYIDSFAEARKVLSEEVGASLLTLARDVKVQVEFNPAYVAEYRLIGYETRALNSEDFNNDAVDAGDIGSGHAVTALYEITPVGSPALLNDPLRYGTDGATEADTSGEAAYVKLRYKPGDADQSELLTLPVNASAALAAISDAPEAARFATAVAAFGQKLRDNPMMADWDWSEIKALANAARGSDENGYRAEFVRLVGLAETIDQTN